MDQTLKKAICLILAVFILSVAYYGNYLPLRKSQLFISTLRTLNSTRSLEAAEDQLSVSLDAPSPVGQEELVRNVGNILMNLIQQNNDPATIANITGYLENYYKPVIDYGRGMSFEQNLYILGVINELAFVKTQDAKYLSAARNYYSEGLSLGPKRPQFLYGMFDIYRISGDVENSKKTADRILSQWPDDERTREGLSEFLSKVPLPAKK